MGGIVGGGGGGGGGGSAASVTPGPPVNATPLGPIGPPRADTAAILATLDQHTSYILESAILPSNPWPALKEVQLRFNATALSHSLRFLPEATDEAPVRKYVPRNAPTSAAACLGSEFFPVEPLPALETPAMFAKLPLDTLFFIFYYMQATYAQFLALRELKRRDWRFHKRYNTWFLRAEEPVELTSNHEKTHFQYFDCALKRGRQKRGHDPPSPPPPPSPPHRRRANVEHEVKKGLSFRVPRNGRVRNGKQTLFAFSK
jgi:hypothetical protein